VNRIGAPRPRQAVLVGGVSTAAGVVSNGDVPFMADVGGRPFLTHLIDLLCDQGFNRFVMLLGRLSGAARDYFGDGQGRGIRIAYPHATEALSPAALTLAARSDLEDEFLLMHADTYWPMRFESMWSVYCASDAAAMATVYNNRDGYAMDTVKVNAGLVDLFDPTGQSPAHGADVGCAIVQRDALDLMSSDQGTVESALYPPLIERRALAVYPTEHRFYSVSTPERLAMLRIFLARGPTVIVDCDGVLNRGPVAPDSVRSVAAFEWLPGALEALRAFRDASYRVIVVCRSRGVVSVRELEAIHDLMRRQAHAAGGRIDALYQCPHDWFAGCNCRKPRPGLLFQAQRDFSLDLTRTIVLGADERTMRAASEAGAVGRLVTTDMPLIAHARDILQLRTPV